MPSLIFSSLSNLNMNVELKHIHKHFGPVHANDDISLTIPAGTIQGILGENGAGKSTLMKVLSGFNQADSGEIILDGKSIRITRPADAITFGIGMLHQDPLDFPPMKVIDNFIIGQPGNFFPNYKKTRAQFLEFQKQYGFNIDPDSYVDKLTVGERQQLEIIRLTFLGARVLILDEPTTGISALQKEKLFETLRILAKEGKTIIFVSHKLEDVNNLCHRVAVLRHGKLVGQAIPPFSMDDLVTLMFGEPISLGDRISSEYCDECLIIDRLGIEDARLTIKNVNLVVKRGEVVGLAGMEGSGQRHFLRTLSGLIRPVSGKIILNNKNLTGKPYQNFLKNGISYVPASRLEEGLISGLTLTEHFSLSEKQQGFFINQAHTTEVAESRIKEFSIRGTPGNRVEMLSGGNQQRALLALLKSPLALILMEHPTRGLDIESTIYIWSKLKDRCQQGTSIIFMSADLDEVLRYSDKVVVFFNGKVSHPLDAKNTSVDELGLLIGGKGWETIAEEGKQ